MGLGGMKHHAECTSESWLACSVLWSTESTAVGSQASACWLTPGWSAVRPQTLPHSEASWRSVGVLIPHASLLGRIPLWWAVLLLLSGLTFRCDSADSGSSLQTACVAELPVIQTCTHSSSLALPFTSCATLDKCQASSSVKRGQW